MNATIFCDIPRPCDFRVEVFQVDGRLVRHLIQRTARPARYRLTWDGSDDRGNYVGSGIYFVRMQAGAFEARRKLVVIR
jgi:flagellar hook assembly protein FlgD